MYSGLMSVISSPSPIGSPTRTIADIRPRPVSALSLRACRCRSRTVSASVSKRPASEPPVWDWTFTAVATYSKSLDPIRSHIAASASSSGRPSRSSPSTRPNSSEEGAAPSSAIARRAGRRPWPARSVEAIVARTSGSWRSNACVRRRATTFKTTNGVASPTSISSRASAGGAPSDRADDAEDEGCGNREIGDVAGAQLDARALQHACQTLRAGQSAQRALCPGEQRLQRAAGAGPRSAMSRSVTCGSSRRLSSDERRRRRPAAAAPASSSAASPTTTAAVIGLPATALGTRPGPFRPGIRTGVFAVAPAAWTASVSRSPCLAVERYESCHVRRAHGRATGTWRRGRRCRRRRRHGRLSRPRVLPGRWCRCSRRPRSRTRSLGAARRRSLA